MKRHNERENKCNLPPRWYGIALCGIDFARIGLTDLQFLLARPVILQLLVVAYAISVPNIA
eukprot:490693-Rhodomonas_salina.2